MEPNTVLSTPVPLWVSAISVIAAGVVVFFIGFTVYASVKLIKRL
jgi:hypothetical protein